MGGGEQSLVDIVRHYRSTSSVVVFEEGPLRDKLAEEGVDVHIMGGNNSIGKVSREGGMVQDLSSIPGVLRLSWRVARFAQQFDLLYANSQKAMIVAVLAGFLARKPVIWHLRDVMSADHFSRAHCRLVAVFANLFIKRVIANSVATRDAVVKAGVRANRVTVVQNGIDPAPFASITSGEAAELRARLGLAGVPVVGVFSRLARWKGQHILLDALCDLPDVHALIVGGSLFQEDHQYEAELKRKAGQAHLAGRVQFLGARHDVPTLMKVVDIVVHTSVLPEPFGRVIVEGMLARRPVVATGAGGALEIIESGETGCLVPAEDSSSLCAVLRQLLSDKTYAENLASAGEKSALEGFTVGRMLQQLDVQVHQVASRNVTDR